MAYKWKPSASARREFASNMKNDPQFASDYYARKEAKADKRRSGSQFDYNSAGGNYIPTQAQYDAAMSFTLVAVTLTTMQRDAIDIVIMAYINNEKCHHDYIHIVNELRRSAI